jgi:transcriptional regulator with XRE-family HTH domain
MGRRSGEFAVAVGTKHPHLSNIEAGRANASPALLKRIADELGVTMGAVTIPVPEPHREEVPA